MEDNVNKTTERKDVINMSRLYQITKDEVLNAWKAVKKSGGGCGHDRQTIQDVEQDLDNQLYKIWNRMTSGSYIAQPVLLVQIPKAKGGFRTLGIPTVTDRIAQAVIKNRLNDIVDEKFHVDSYAYREGKSAIDAVTAARERCFQHEWLVEIDIKGYFDNIDHDILMEMLKAHTDDKCILLYAQKFLKAPGINEEGEKSERTMGTPQGGVVSPVLANLYLHETFDQWMQKGFGNIAFERYADDIVIHCKSEAQAYYIRNRIQGRLHKFKLTMHPEKTRIVYTGLRKEMDKRGHDLPRKFTFLGYEFKLRSHRSIGKDGKEYFRTVFTPGIGANALKMIRLSVKKWGLKHRLSDSLETIALEINPVIRGWINYYGHHRRSELYKLAEMIDTYLGQFIKKKHKAFNTWNRAWKELGRLKKHTKRQFCHWFMIGSSK